MINDYTKQAAVWDWDAYEDTAEYDFWRDYANTFGRQVLLPMCALGKTGISLAERGLFVTAFDITPEMIARGKALYHDRIRKLQMIFPFKTYYLTENISHTVIPKHKGELKLEVADITDLHLEKQDFDFALIAGNGDLHLLPNIDAVEKAFANMAKHLRPGGALVLELTLPGDTSWHSPKRVFHPRVPGYTDKKVWKENESTYDAHTRQHLINQTVYIEDENGADSFTQQICLQLYPREEILGRLEKCGFTIAAEYSNREKEPWQPGDTNWIVEAIKQ